MDIELNKPGVLTYPSDGYTPEEHIFLGIVKAHMLQKLPNPVEKFLFVYIIEQGNSQYQASIVLNVNETNISRHMKKIRKRLLEFKQGYECKDSPHKS